MAEYYEQGVTPPTQAEAALSRYARFARNGHELAGAELDELIRTEALRIGESALGGDGGAIGDAELKRQAAAAFTAAGLIDREAALASLARLSVPFEAGASDQAIERAAVERDRSSATATPRRDMNPALAARLGITPNRGLKQDEIAFLLNGQRADGGAIKGKAIQNASIPLSDLFGLEPAVRPTPADIEQILAGRTAAGGAVDGMEVEKAVRRFIAALGVTTKAMTEEQRANIVAGRRADGSELSDREYRNMVEAGKARIGYIDLTFSAPKSLSVAWAFAPTAAERAMLHQAHNDAISQVMNTVEAEIGRARKGKGGRDGFEPGSIGWVTFDHYAARPTVEVVRPDAQGQIVTELHTITGSNGRAPGDMQVHTHVAIFNAVETASGRVGGLDLAQLDGRIKEWGALYQAYLASNLRQHGIEVGLDRTNEMARLTAVPENVILQFSKRTNGGTDAARAYAESQGLVWDELDPERKIGLLKSGVQNPREAKTDDVSDLTAWKAMANKIGYEHRSVLRPDAISAVTDRATRLEAAYHASLPLLGKQFDRRAVLAGADIRVAAAKGLIAAGIEKASDVDDLTRAYRERGIKRRGQDAGLVWGSVPGTQGQQKTAITTTLEEAEERTLIAIASAGGRDRSAALSSGQIAAAVASFPELNFESEHGRAQRAAMQTLGTGGRVALAIGVAGSGKSTLLKPLVKAWEDDGRTVYGIALAWRQSSDLADAGIQKDRTRAVDSFLNALSKEKISLDSSTVVVVDEVGLLGTRQLNQILVAQKKAHFQLVMIGDPKQMQSIEAGPVIALLRQALGEKAVPELGSSVRQNDIEDRETTLMFRNGETAAAIERKFANGTLQIAPGGYRDAISHVAELWKQRKIENADRPGYTMSISAPTNAEAHEISLAIREVRRRMGEIGADKLRISATDGTASRTYQMALAEGDNVRLFKRINATFSDTGRPSNIGQNGSVLKIAQITDDGLMLETPLGKTGFVPWSRLKTEDGRVQLAYGDALTTNTAQGSTVSEHIHAMPSGTSQVTAFGAYVSGSRHREQSFIVTSEGAERSEIADRRPLGDRRPVSQRDILDNMARNLARQPEKESALALIAKASELRRSTIQTVQKTLQPLERREAADELKTQLRERAMTRRVTQQLRSRLPGLSEALRRQGERLNKVTRAGAAMAQRVVTAARKRTAHATSDRDYWKSVADQAKEQVLGEGQTQIKRRIRSN